MLIATLHLPGRIQFTGTLQRRPIQGEYLDVMGESYLVANVRDMPVGCPLVVELDLDLRKASADAERTRVESERARLNQPRYLVHAQGTSMRFFMAPLKLGDDLGDGWRVCRLDQPKHQGGLGYAWGEQTEELGSSGC